MTSAANFLASWALPISIGATFVLTLLFATRIKDFANGVPSDLRKGLTSIESGTLAKVRAAQKAVVAEATPIPAPVPKPTVPASVGVTGPAA